MLELNSILMYGRDYGENPQPVWWFNMADEQVVDARWLREFGYRTMEQVEASPFLIPMFRTNIIAEERLFLQRQPRSPRLRQLMAMPDHQLDSAFRAYIEQARLLHDWRVWEQQALRRDGEKWCSENRIQYR